MWKRAFPLRSLLSSDSVSWCATGGPSTPSSGTLVCYYTQRIVALSDPLRNKVAMLLLLYGTPM